MLQKPLVAEAAPAPDDQAERMAIVGHLAGGVAHDFNNLLTVIMGTIEVLGEGVADRPELAAIAGLIAEAAARGADLTSHLLAFARGQPTKPREVDVNKLLSDAARLLRPTLGEQVDIDVRLASNVAPAWVDASRLMTVILDLAVLARDMMPDGGTLVLESRTAATAEHGAGPATSGADRSTADPATIVVSVLPYRTSARHQPAFAELGTAAGFIAGADGNIKVYREVGRDFSVGIHLQRAAGFAGLRVRPSDKLRMEGGDQAILIVEDDALVRRYVVSQVQSLGYQTLCAGDAREAMKIVEANGAIDLLFTDVMMPGSINGRQLAIEALKRRPALRVLYTSGYAEIVLVHNGALDPGVLLLAKPYRKVDLARMICVALAV